MSLTRWFKANPALVGTTAASLLSAATAAGFAFPPALIFTLTLLVGILAGLVTRTQTVSMEVIKSTPNVTLPPAAHVGRITSGYATQSYIQQGPSSPALED